MAVPVNLFVRPAWRPAWYALPTAAFAVTRGTDTAIQTSKSDVERVGGAAQAAAAIWRSPVSLEAAMTYLSWRPERLIPASLRDGLLARAANIWDRVVAILTSPDLSAVVMVCVIGLLATFALLLLPPNSRELIISIQEMF